MLSKLWRRTPLYVKDLTERVVRTFIAAFGMTYLAEIPKAFTDVPAVESLVSASVSQKALVAGIMAVGSLITGLLGKGFGPTDTASVVKSLEPVHKPPPPPPTLFPN
jgi:hypothetical protein